jgi:hypothetical protein
MAQAKRVGRSGKQLKKFRPQAKKVEEIEKQPKKFIRQIKNSEFN